MPKYSASDLGPGYSISVTSAFSKGVIFPAYILPAFALRLCNAVKLLGK